MIFLEKLVRVIAVVFLALFVPGVSSANFGTGVSDDGMALSRPLAPIIQIGGSSLRSTSLPATVADLKGHRRLQCG